MRDDPVVADLVTRARKGDQQAWDVLVERYSPLIWSICRHYRLSRADAEDVGAAHLAAVREPPGRDPRACRASWLADHHDQTGMQSSRACGQRTAGRRAVAG